MKRFFKLAVFAVLLLVPGIVWAAGGSQRLYKIHRRHRGMGRNAYSGRTDKIHFRLRPFRLFDWRRLILTFNVLTTAL